MWAQGGRQERPRSSLGAARDPEKNRFQGREGPQELPGWLRGRIFGVFFGDAAWDLNKTGKLYIYKQFFLLLVARRRESGP